jgi:hypothetical protein
MDVPEKLAARKMVARQEKQKRNLEPGTWKSEKVKTESEPREV